MPGEGRSTGTPGEPAGHRPTAEVLRVLFERAPEIITLNDDESRQVLVNPAARRLLGIPPPTEVPYDGWSHVHPDDVPALLALRQYFDSRPCPAEPPPPVRCRVRDASGAWRWLEMVVADLRDVPEVGGRVTFSRDVTEAEQRAQALRESRARLDALVASLRAGAMVEDAEGTVILANDLLLAGFGIPGDAAVLVGRSRDEALGILAGALLDSSALLAAARQPADGHGDLECELRSGTWFDVEVVPIRAEGQDFGRLWLFHDTTARRRAEQQRQHLLDLEQQARRDAELQAERLQSYDRLRNEFVAHVSHELRTPLTSIASASELLLSDDSASTELVRQRLEIVRRNAERLRRMIEDLLLVGPLDAGMLTLEQRPVALPALVRDTVAQLLPHAQARDVALVVEAPADGLIQADPRRLQEVVENLLGNAIKFTKPGTEVVVRVAPAGAGWQLSVRDHGPGIPPALRARIFERFVRSTDADRRGIPGAGLGLAIVQGIVNLHGGSVSAHDAPGGGAVFECFLPGHVHPAGR